MLSRYFIDRPIFAWVIAIGIMLAGLGGMLSLPVAQYPDIALPQVAIQAVDWFVPEHHLSMYWFKVSFLRGVSPRSTDLGDWLGSA